MNIDYGAAAYSRERGNLPELPLINMFVESAKTEPGQVCLQSRPGLEDNGVTSGAGPVAGIFQKDGVLSGDLFTVSAGNLYRAGVLVGAIGGSGTVSMAGNEIGLVINAGADVYYYDGTTLALADFPDNADVCKVYEIAGRFCAIRSGTQKRYWTETLETALVAGILTFNALDFASAENEPDQLIDACVVDDKEILGGRETIEFWSKTGDSDLPFSPIEGLVFEKGVKATGCLVPFDNTAVFVSGDGLVYRCSNVPQRISDAGIEERISGSATASLFTFFFEGHEFLCLRLDTCTMAYNGQTRQWCEFASDGETNWIARCAVPGPIFGSAVDGKTLAFGDTHSDLDRVLERRFRAGIALDEGSVSIDNIRLRCNPGQASISGDYTDPVIEMRVSRDGGNSWGDWKPTKLGVQGAYRQRVEWRALGMFDDPGFLAEFRVTDPVAFRMSGVTVNNRGGGRARA